MRPSCVRSRVLMIFTALVGACTTPAPTPVIEHEPIVFVHGNGDSAALWITTIWRFESNGWPRNRLFAFDVTYPLARDLDDVAQDGRTSTRENMLALAHEVDTVLDATGAKQVVLIGNSRGGFAIRDYILNGGGSTRVSAVILGGTPNHGVFFDPAHRLSGEFNGAGPFLTRLNEQGGPDSEITPGMRWLTVRSDHNDKYAQPDGLWIGAKGTPTQVTSEGPALKGAENVELAGIDHRETSFSAVAFEQDYRFLTRQSPLTLAITPESTVVLDGVVSGVGLNNQQGTFASNLPLTGASVAIYATDPATGARLGPARREVTIGANGRWGPFTADPLAHYEFVISMTGYATTHIYRSTFPRSSSYVNLRAERLADADRSAGAVVTFTRPRGYFGVPRDTISFDGKSPPDGLPPGTPGLSTVKITLADAPERSVVGEFNGERIAGRTWPASGNHVVLLELHY